MLRLTSEISIGQYKFNSCVELEIKSSWDSLTDTCTITIPRKIKWDNKSLAQGAAPMIAIGDKVVVKLGYNFQFKTYFTGYVIAISAKTPVTIECQDAFWFLKQCSGSFSLGSGTTLSQVMSEVEKIYNSSSIKKTHGVTINFKPLAGTVVGTFRADRVSMAFVVKTLKEKLGIISFTRNEILYSGLTYYDDQRGELQRNFTDNVIEDSLEFKKATDIKIKLVVKSVDNKNLKPVEVGDSDGDTRTYYVAGMSSQAQMKAVGDRELPRFKYTGWHGSFTTFGDVFVKHGDVVELIDKQIKDRNGKYFVKGVTTKFGTGGFRNIIELDKQA